MNRITVMVLIFVFLLGAFPALAADDLMSVKDDRAYVRKEPKPKADVLYTVLKHFPVKIIKKHFSWYYVEDFEGDKGWIYSKSLTSKTRCAIVKGNEYANIRSGPSTKEKVIYKADLGVAFEVLKTKDEWLNIKHANGKTGWVHESLMWGHKE